MVAVAGVAKDRPVVIIATNDVARQWGLRAGELVQGRGAGVLAAAAAARTTWPRAAAPTPRKIGEALAQVEHAVGERVTAGR